MLRRPLSLCALVFAFLIALPAAAYACGGLVAPGHAEVLQRATTLAAWHDGVEHYVTGFQFAGSASRFGYIIPLPGVPTSIQKGGGFLAKRRHPGSTCCRVCRSVRSTSRWCAAAARTSRPGPRPTDSP